MRCYEAKQKLTQLVSSRSPLDIGDDLRQHLKACRNCSRRFQAALGLRSSLERASKSDNAETIPLAALKTRIEAQVEPASKEAERLNVLERVVNQMRRPRYNVPVAAVIVIVLLAVVLPIKFGNPTEYEVAFANVDPALAQDDAIVRMMLQEVDAADASFTVGSCEENCELLISSIKSEEELGKVIAFFEQAANAQVLSANEIHFDKGDRIIMSVSEDHLNEMRKVEIRISTRVQCMMDSVVPSVVEASEQFEEQFADESQVVLATIGGECCVESFEPGGDSVWVKIVMPGGSVVHRFRGDDGSAEKFLEGYGIDPSFLRDTDDAVAAAKGTDLMPGEFSLGQNFPNPFNPTTDIQFVLPRASDVKLEVFNIKGQRIKTLVNGQMEAGNHMVTFDGSDVASGVYLYRLQADDFVETKKMSLVK